MRVSAEWWNYSNGTDEGAARGGLRGSLTQSIFCYRDMIYSRRQLPRPDPQKKSGMIPELNRHRVLKVSGRCWVISTHSPPVTHKCSLALLLQRQIGGWGGVRDAFHWAMRYLQGVNAVLCCKQIRVSGISVCLCVCLWEGGGVMFLRGASCNLNTRQ